MYLKIVFKNVKKNVRDYGIYFLTLLISVSIFYAFNSIESQPAIRQMAYDGNGISKQMIALIGIVSKFVAVMLAFLIIYANNFLLKRRKKEMGIFMILGMSDKKISLLFVGETLIIGILALLVGLGMGAFLSQGISVIALKMFNFDLSSYKFVFSINALKESVICFGIIYLFVIIFNVRTIRKVKLIDMLTASRKNEEAIVKSKFLHALIILGAFCLYGLTFYFVREGSAFDPTKKQAEISILSLVLATAMVIYSGTYIVFSLLRKNKNWYYKNINTFLVRQLNSKIQSNFITMTVVTLLVTSTICVVLVGLGMADSMNQTARNATPFDVLILKDEEGRNESVEQFEKELEDNGLSIDETLDDYIIYPVYFDENFKYSEIINDSKKLAKIDENLPQSLVSIIGISDYNKAMKLQGKDTLENKENAYYVNSNYKGTNDLILEFIERQQDIEIGGRILTPACSEVYHNTYYMSAVGINDQGTIIVPDDVKQNLVCEAFVLVGNYKNDADISAFENEMIGLMADAVNSPIDYMTKNLILESYYSIFAIVSFVCSYIGIILLIICVAVLSLQQLTQTNDNVFRYQVLHKIGVDTKMCEEALFKQILTYFGVPLIVGIVYSSIAMPKLTTKLQAVLGMNIGNQILYIVSLLFVIYGSYFVLTFLSCKKIIKERAND